MAEMSSLLPEVPSQGTARARNDLLSAVRGDAPSRGGLGAAVASEQRPLGGPLKRGVDLLGAAASLLVFMPIALMIALLILLTMGRPVLFAHPRVGFQRKLFNCHKFRSMVRDPDGVLQRYLADNPEAAREWSETQKLRNDPRVTLVGRMLRKSSLDELPQLINVLRGEMSLVGPRPVVAGRARPLRRHGAALPLHAPRHDRALAGERPHLGGLPAAGRAGRDLRPLVVALARPQDPGHHDLRPTQIQRRGLSPSWAEPEERMSSR